MNPVPVQFQHRRTDHPGSRTGSPETTGVQRQRLPAADPEVTGACRTGSCRGTLQSRRRSISLFPESRITRLTLQVTVLCLLTASTASAEVFEPKFRFLVKKLNLGADEAWWSLRTSTPLVAVLRLAWWVRLPRAPAKAMGDTDKLGTAVA